MVDAGKDLFLTSLLGAVLGMTGMHTVLLSVQYTEFAEFGYSIFFKKKNPTINISETKIKYCKNNKVLSFTHDNKSEREGEWKAAGRLKREQWEASTRLPTSLWMIF